MRLPTEPNVVLSVARVLATPAEAPFPSPGRVSTGIGGTQGGRLREKCDSRAVQAPPTSDGPYMGGPL
jgi:hypothetical protein